MYIRYCKLVFDFWFTIKLITENLKKNRIKKILGGMV